MKNVRVTTTGNHGDSHFATISGLTEDEAKQLEGAVAGANWVRAEGGRLKTVPAHESLPNPTTDEKMLPFWRQHSNTDEQTQLLPKVFDDMSDDVIFMPHITIMNVCGYNYSRENYSRETKKLESYGFVQLRSQRGADGKFWELWYLPGVWFAKGDLKEVVDEVTRKSATWEDPLGRRKDAECFKSVLEFLRKNSSFGTLDVSIQRICAVLCD